MLEDRRIDLAGINRRDADIVGSLLVGDAGPQGRHGKFRGVISDAAQRRRRACRKSKRY